MESNWAVENLQTIRTLMERSAVYRRALAPVATFAGVVGILGVGGGLGVGAITVGVFAAYWMAVSLIAIAGGLLLVRRQALRSSEPFWSPPTRRVAQAMLPAMLAGLAAGSYFAVLSWNKEAPEVSLLLVPIWMLLYGLALHAASFFMPKGIRLFAWLYIASGLMLGGFLLFVPAGSGFNTISTTLPHLAMGVLFGLAHLLYGGYLYFTEARKNDA